MNMFSNYDQRLLDHVKKIHFIGCGGSGMYPLIQILAAKGYEISGSDVLDGSTIRAEREMGVKVSLGHNADNIIGADLVVYSAAIPKDNVELAAAESYGISTVERSVLLGYISRLYKNSICVSGTHGKTTTTAMMSTVALKNDMDPTVMIGGNLSSIGGSMRIGSHDYFVAEACEYKNSYHKFSPTVAVILNVDRDHVDFFKSMDETLESFRHFALQVPKDTGVVIANHDDPSTQKAIEGIDRKVISFGFSPEADVHPEYIKDSRGFFSFSIYIFGNHYCDVKLVVPGRHNVLDSLAAAAASYALGIDGEAFKKGIQSYTGVSRRFEYKTTVNMARVFDDYSHHPKEIAMALIAADAMGDGRTICVFQPHTYSRTEALFDSFAKALSHADIVVLAEIFAAREDNVHGISSAQLAEKIPHSHFFKTFVEIADFIKETAREGDIVITMGAGDIYKVCDLL